MELKEQPLATTLARRLGDVPHVSGLLRRIARISGADDRVTNWLLKVAVQRGARHYQRAFDPALPPDAPAITDEEIGIALCLGEQPYDLDRLRAAAQLLTSAAWRCRNAANRCCCTLRTWPNDSCRHCIRGPISASTCPRAPCRAPTPCHIGVGW
ncbi:MAG TPA: hypothetical protein VNO52_05385 [Methylomirabilota bacterium]|nr:hypothetical protein [Methylomirabilota bacterium]